MFLNQKLPNGEGETPEHLSDIRYSESRGTFFLSEEVNYGILESIGPQTFQDPENPGEGLRLDFEMSTKRSRIEMVIVNVENL